MKRLLVVVDMQNDFVSGALGSPAAEAVVPAVKEIISCALKEGWRVVYTQDTHGEDYLSTNEGRRLPVLHCIKGSHGWEIVSELKPLRGRVFEKGAFGSIALAEYARDNEYGEITLSGVCTDICVISNALLLKAYCPEADVRVAASACAGTTAENHAAALIAMKSCQVEIN